MKESFLKYPINNNAITHLFISVRYCIDQLMLILRVHKESVDSDLGEDQTAKKNPDDSLNRG